MQEASLLSSVLRVLDLENCEIVREVRVLDSPEAGVRAAVQRQQSGGSKETGTLGPGGTEEEEEGLSAGALRPELVLRGCPDLPAATRARLRAAVLGAS